MLLYNSQGALKIGILRDGDYLKGRITAQSRNGNEALVDTVKEDEHRSHVLRLDWWSYEHDVHTSWQVLLCTRAPSAYASGNIRGNAFLICKGPCDALNRNVYAHC